MFLIIKDVTNESPYPVKLKYSFQIQCHKAPFAIQLSHVNLKIATM